MPKPNTMAPEEFDKRVEAIERSGLQVKAARLVLVEGKGIREAARKVHIDATLTSRVVAELRGLTLCGHCGQAIRTE